ncbi:sensor histidine kinase [Actinomycetospora straminea]|uniref:sensor histidine kinase n=1 Tax=Actinomycetospora straminea TaxID=663607 RepID=UPI0023670384|nr:ATP-binding protein [Actinomycetospora straminea]MDD7936430.1 ATP-binding protein [Actinomycetospora straminea]
MTVPVLVTVVVALLAAALGAVAGAAAVRWKRDEPGRERARGVRGPTVAELLARLVRRSQSGIAVINRFGDVVLANERAEALGAVVDARPDPRVTAAAERVATGAEPCEVDLSPATHPPGSTPRPIVAHVRPLGDGFVVVDATDTSAAVRLEAVRRDFVANVGHELKTPVGALAVLAEAVLDADDPDEVAHFATRILNESHRLGALVTELISLSRLQGAERLPELVRVDVDEVLGEALKRVRVPAEAAASAAPEDASDPRERFLLDAPSGLEVAGDRTLLVTALTNLLENAVAYSPEGTPVSVRRRRQGDRIEISVTDRGIGIAPEHQQRVFERFFRVDPARSRATGGTGLGLAIVKHVAANHGGEVRLWSQPGVGSTFTLRVPAAPADDDPDDREADPDLDDLDADLAYSATAGHDPAPSVPGGSP